MKLGLRIALAFALVAVFAAGLTGWLSYQQARDHFQGFVAGNEAQRGNPPPGAMPGRGRQVLLDQLWASSLRSTLLALVVALGAGTYLAFRLVQPVRALTDATRRYGRGERSARVPAQGDDELAELGWAFNDVAGRLALKEERERQMVADIAHELRTPLTVLKGDLESMHDGLLETSKANLRRLIGEVDLLTRLVRDLRTLSLSDSGQLALKPQPLPLDALVEEVVAAFRSKAEARQVQLETNLEAVVVSADPERLQQVLFNLLDNALRHTPPGGWVRLRLRRESQEVRLEVSNSGAGIDPQHLPHLFERFYRAEATPEGSGLGLAIVQTLAEAHRGRVGVENFNGGGVCFWLVLPQSQSSTDSVSHQ